MQEWPADKVERWSVGRLVPYARNARTHSDAQIAQLAGSIREWGWTTPILVDENGTLIAGHGRVLAARQLGLAEIPVMVARGWSEAQKRAYVIADNKLALSAGWDVELLRVELTDLKAMGADLGLVGFGDGELAELFADRSVGLTDPDDVLEPLPEPVTAAGDVWVLGRHRLVCGDSTDPETVDRALARTSPHLMVTDPPYGVNYDPKWRAKAGVNALDGLLRAVAASAILAGLDMPHGGLRPVTTPMRVTAHGVPARFMLPMVVATSKRKAVLAPNDLRAPFKTAGFQ